MWCGGCRCGNLGQNQCEPKQYLRLNLQSGQNSKPKIYKSAKFRLKREVSRRIPSKNIIRYKLLLLKIAIAFSFVWVNSTCFILLYGGDVFVFHMLASQIAISHKENTHMGRLYIFVLGGITFILFNVRLCGIIFAYSHLLAYCLLCGDMSVNPLLLITHCQDENRQLISFWNEYSWRSVLGGICC